MEWVVVVLALGCLIFIAHMLSDYLKRKRDLEPKLRRLDEAKEKLQAQIQASKGTLDEQRGQLLPLRDELSQIEQEARAMQQQPPGKGPRKKPAADDQAKDQP